jgi:hypothetical protein
MRSVYVPISKVLIKPVKSIGFENVCTDLIDYATIVDIKSVQKV